MNASMILKSAIVCFALSTSALASTYGSVEPIATPEVIDTGLLKAQRLDVRAAFAERLLQCGIVDQVIAVLVSTRSITTINGLNTHIEVGAGGFFGETNPSYVFTIICALFTRYGISVTMICSRPFFSVSITALPRTTTLPRPVRKPSFTPTTP